MNACIRHARRHDAYHIIMPTESDAELFALSERAIDNLNIPAQMDKRWVVIE